MMGIYITAVMALIVDAVVAYLALGIALAEFKGIYIPFMEGIMIDREYGRYIAICDACGDSIGKEETFDDVRMLMRAEGWVTRKHKNHWVNYCDKCVYEERKERYREKD